MLQSLPNLPKMSRSRLWLTGTVLLANCLVTGAICNAGQQGTEPVAAAMTDAARNFLAALSPAEKAKATRSFDDPARVDWHNIPKPERKGLQVREMNAKTRELCHELLKAALSDEGYEKAVLIMSLESNLKEGEKNLSSSPLRDPERYFLTIFGEPTLTGPWGWSFEGHHFSLNYVVRNGQVLAATPSFWGANPATVHIFVEGGPEVGVRTLAGEEQTAFDLVQSLDAEQQKVAIIADKAPNDYRAAGQPQPPQAAPAGLAFNRMNADQQQLVKSLVTTYVRHWEQPLAEATLNGIQEAGWDKVHFAWLGSTKPGVGHSYRIQGPTFVLELVNIQADPAGNLANHIHSVWRDVRGDFAVPVK